jgi:glycosyltransferase involved in cell wall biosynthesis
MKPLRVPDFFYLGTVIPDCPPYNGKAFSRAGNLAQLGLLRGLASIGSAPSRILTQRPLESFPGSRTLFVRKQCTELETGQIAELIPFFNLPIIRPIMVGLYVFITLIRWSRKLPRGSHKLVFTFNLTEPSGLFTLIASRLIGARAIAWINDINLPGETVPGNWMRRLDFWLHKKIMPRFDGLVVVNKNIAKDFAPNSRFICIDGGVRSQIVYAPNVQNNVCQSRTFFCIVAAGSLDDQNGIAEILDAFALLKEPFYKLKIAGAGPLKGRIQEAQLKDPRIEYCGYLDHEQIQELYQSADLLINMRLSNRIKTPYFFPSKLLEYMASGTPVITTFSEHIQEQYSNFVFILKDETPEGLANMIRYVKGIGNELSRQKGLAAHEAMRLFGTWETRAKVVVEFIQKSYVNEKLPKI